MAEVSQSDKQSLLDLILVTVPELAKKDSVKAILLDKMISYRPIDDFVEYYIDSHSFGSTLILQFGYYPQLRHSVGENVEVRLYNSVINAWFPARAHGKRNVDVSFLVPFANRCSIGVISPAGHWVASGY